MQPIISARDNVFVRTAAIGVDLSVHPHYPAAKVLGWKSVQPTASGEQVLARYHPHTGAEILVPHGGQKMGLPEGYTHYAMGDDGVYTREYPATTMYHAFTQAEDNPGLNGYRRVHNPTGALGGDNPEAINELLQRSRDAYLQAE